MTLSQSECEFTYRGSKFQFEDLIILEVLLELKQVEHEEIEERMKELLLKRKQSQPLKMPNAGCIFKNPESDSAGRLIDEAGGKGLQVGGAKVSKKHANFIVNTGNATAKDILSLMDKVRSLVKEKYGIELESEIKVLDNGR
jgi:UDP-N-acetylmuramate dehydrogenase